MPSGRGLLLPTTSQLAGAAPPHLYFRELHPRSWFSLAEIKGIQTVWIIMVSGADWGAVYLWTDPTIPVADYDLP